MAVTARFIGPVLRKGINHRGVQTNCIGHLRFLKFHVPMFNETGTTPLVPKPQSLNYCGSWTSARHEKRPGMREVLTKQGGRARLSWDHKLAQSIRYRGKTEPCTEHGRMFSCSISVSSLGSRPKAAAAYFFPPG